MPWKTGKIKLDDGTIYPAELLVKDNGEVWNIKVHKGNNVVEEIDAESFASRLGKNSDQVYPFTYEIDD